MVDLENLESRPLNKLYTVEGFTCQECNTWRPCWYSSLQLQESMRHLNQMRPDHHSFQHYLGKVYKRAIEIQRRGRNIIDATIGEIKTN